MADHQPKSKRTSFIGKRLGGIRSLVGKTSHSNSNSSGEKAATPPSSTTPNKTKKKLRQRTNSFKRIPDDVPAAAPARATAQLQQLAQKQSSVADASKATVTATATTNESTATTTTTTAQSTGLDSTSAAGVRQRLQEIKEMISKGKEEMGLLQDLECIKVQALVRGYLVRKKPKQQQTSKTMPRRPHTIPNTKKKKRRVKKTPTDNDIATTRDGEALKKRRTVAATKIQAVVRGYLQRKHNAKTKTSPKSKKDKKTRVEGDGVVKDKAAAAAAAANELNPSDALRDHYAWNPDEEGGQKDHYAWTPQATDKPTTVERKDYKEHYSWQDEHYAWDGEVAKPTNNNQHQQPKKHHPHRPKGSNHSNRRRSFTKEDASALKKTGSAKAKAKNRRVISMKSKDHINDLSMKDQSHHSEYSWKDHSMRDQSHTEHLHSMKDQSMADHSMPFHELVMTSSKESSGSITHTDVSRSVMAVTEEVQEDSRARADSFVTSSYHASSFRSSAASSFLSKLTDDEDDDDDKHDSLNGNFTSRAGPQDDEEEASEEADLLDLSVMATAPMIHTPAALTEKDLLFFAGGGNEPKRRRLPKKRQPQQHDEDDASAMALSPRRSETESDTEAYTEDDSRASYAYDIVPQTGRRVRRNQGDDVSVSVMAVAELSDLEGDSEFDLDDNETEYNKEDYEFEYDEDIDETVMAVAWPEDGDSDRGDDEVSVAFNAREDDMSITSIESNLPRENSSCRDRRRRRRYEVDDAGDEIVEAEDVSVLTTASNKRHKKNYHIQRQRTKKSASTRKPKAYHNQFLLPQYASESSEEESYLQRRRRQRRSRKSMTKKGKRPSQSRNPHVDSEDEEELQRRLEEVNCLIAESRKEMEDLMEAEATKIQAFFRMHHERKQMDSSGRNCPGMRDALSRTGTKEMNGAAKKIQSFVRQFQARSMFEKQRKSRKHTRRNRKQRAKDIEQKALKEQAKLKQRLEEVEHEMKVCQGALEAQKATKVQALLRGFLVRSKGLENHIRVAATRKIQHFVRAALRTVHLRKRLSSIKDDKVKQLQEVKDRKKKSMDEFEAGKFDNMDTRVKMVNYLKKQIEKENETTEKLWTQIQNVKENNVRLMTANSSSVCTVERLKIDVQTKEDKRDALLKLNQEWIDGIKEYENRVKTCIANTKTQVWQKEVTKKYIDTIAHLFESRYANKKLVKEIRFLADHSEDVGGSMRRASEVIALD